MKNEKVSVYAKELSFDYIETYSLLRSKVLDGLETDDEAEYRKLQSRKGKGEQLSEKEEAFLAETAELEKYYGGLRDDKGRLHFSAEKTHTLRHDDPRVVRLMELLRMKPFEVFYSLCAPVYRDAIVFYDSAGRIVAVLNICLSCGHMQAEPARNFDVDIRVYGLLRHWFRDLGHKVEKKEGPLSGDLLAKLNALYPLQPDE